MREAFTKWFKKEIHFWTCAIKGGFKSALSSFLKSAIVLLVVAMVSVYNFIHKHWIDLFVGVMASLIATMLWTITI